VCAYGAHDQGVAIASRLGHHVAANVAACAGFVVDHNGLAQLCFFAEQTCQDVGRAASGEGHNQTNGLVGVGLRHGGWTCKKSEAQRTDQAKGANQLEADTAVGLCEVFRKLHSVAPIGFCRPTL